LIYNYLGTIYICIIKHRYNYLIRLSDSFIQFVHLIHFIQASLRSFFPFSFRNCLRDDSLTPYHNDKFFIDFLLSVEFILAWSTKAARVIYWIFGWLLDRSRPFCLLGRLWKDLFIILNIEILREITIKIEETFHWE